MNEMDVIVWNVGLKTQEYNEDDHFTFNPHYKMQFHIIKLK
jgi:hypothetical protein